MTANQTNAVSEDHIRAIAYSLWLEEGQPEGRAENHWQRALELVNEAAVPSVKPKRKVAAASKAAPRKRS